MYKTVFFLFVLILSSLTSNAQLIKEKDYSVWLERFSNQIQADASFGYSEDEFKRYYSNLDRMPIPNDSTDVILYFSKMNQIVNQFFSFDISEEEAMVFRLLVKASPNRILKPTQTSENLFLVFYEKLLSNMQGFDFVDSEIIILIDAIKSAPRPFSHKEKFEKLLDLYMMGSRYDGIRNHLIFEMKNQSADFEDGNIYARTVSVKISALERLRIQIITRENEKALQTVDEWILEERHGKK